MKILAALSALILLFCCGCSSFLPAGDPPGGDIVDNPLPKKMSQEEMILALGSRIAASAMQHFPGGPVMLEADKSSLPWGRAAVSEAGKICGVYLNQAAAAVLNGRQTGKNVFEFELFYFSRSLWRCSFELK
jgi:hypothetical protein